MKIWKFKVVEYGPMKPTTRILEIEAKDEGKALSKVYQLQGNRSWDIFPLGLK